MHNKFADMTASVFFAFMIEPMTMHHISRLPNA